MVDGGVNGQEASGMLCSKAEGIGVWNTLELLGVEAASPPGSRRTRHTRRTGSENRLEVVAFKLRLGPVDHADGALQPRLAQACCKFAAEGAQRAESVDCQCRGKAARSYRQALGART